MTALRSFQPEPSRGLVGGVSPAGAVRGGQRPAEGGVPLRERRRRCPPSPGQLSPQAEIEHELASSILVPKLSAFVTV